MGDLSEIEASGSVKITGGDELYHATVIQEDGVTKLLTKSTTVPDTVNTFVFGKFVDACCSSDMTINGSGTPVSFTVCADPCTNIIIREIKMTAFDGGVKVDTFLGQNSALTNGIQVNIVTNGSTQSFIPIKTTQDFDGHFAYGDGARFEFINASGNDSIIAQFSPREPLILQAGTTDKLEIIIQDNITSVAFLEAIAFGFLGE
jgi:hypothetical protein